MICSYRVDMGPLPMMMMMIAMAVLFMAIGNTTPVNAAATAATTTTGAPTVTEASEQEENSATMTTSLRMYNFDLPRKTRRSMGKLEPSKNETEEELTTPKATTTSTITTPQPSTTSTTSATSTPSTSTKTTTTTTTTTNTEKALLPVEPMLRRCLPSEDINEEQVVAYIMGLGNEKRRDMLKKLGFDPNLNCTKSRRECRRKSHRGKFDVMSVSPASKIGLEHTSNTPETRRSFATETTTLVPIALESTIPALEPDSFTATSTANTTTSSTSSTSSTSTTTSTEKSPPSPPGVIGSATAVSLTPEVKRSKCRRKKKGPKKVH